MQHNERYLLTSEDTLHKLDLNNKPDFQGAEYRIIEESDKGYQVYIVENDESQPRVMFYIAKQFVKE